jgi:hypothetical protein
VGSLADQLATVTVTVKGHVAPTSFGASIASDAVSGAAGGAPVATVAGADVEQLALKQTFAVTCVVPPPFRKVVNDFEAPVLEGGLAPPVAFHVIWVKASAKDVEQSTRAVVASQV